MPLPPESSTERPLLRRARRRHRPPASPAPSPTPPAVLSGRVTRASDGPAPGSAAPSYLYLEHATAVLTVAYADASGNYSFTGLATGTYYVKTNNFDGYIDEAWNNIPCDSSCNPIAVGRDAIAVTDGSTTPNIDFALDRGGRISGTVVNAVTSAPIANLDLDVTNATDRSVTYAYTDAAGVFISYGGLVSGTSLRHDPDTSWNSLGFVDELYDNIPCPFSSCSPTAGTPIAVTSPSTTGGINFALDPGGGLAGTVTDAGTSTGLAGVSVQIYATDGRGVAYRYDRRLRQLVDGSEPPTGDLLRSHAERARVTSTRCGTTSPAPAAIRGLRRSERRARPSTSRPGR